MLTDEVNKIIFEIGKIYSEIPTCAICTKQTKTPKKGFVIHHFDYTNEKKYSDFAKNKKLTTKERLAYYKYLLERVKLNPDKFLFVHKKCHFALEMAVRYSDPKWERISYYRKITRLHQNRNT